MLIKQFTKAIGTATIGTVCIIIYIKYCNIKLIHYAFADLPS